MAVILSFSIYFIKNDLKVISIQLSYFELYLLNYINIVVSVKNFHRNKHKYTSRKSKITVMFFDLIFTPKWPKKYKQKIHTIILIVSSIMYSISGSLEKI